MTIDTLYKYGKLGEHSEAAFCTPTIWFASPPSLNDPFECRPWFTFDGTNDDIVGVIARVLQRHQPQLGTTDVLAQALEIHRNGRHRNQSFWAHFRQDVVAMLAKNIGLCCLTRSNTDILMWSHYAAEHIGYCLEFEATDHTPFFGEAQRVNYATEFPAVDFFRTPNDIQVDLIFLTKFAGWEYEQEYRIIDLQSGAGLHTYPAELLRCVTLGLRMPQSDRMLVLDWLKGRGSDVKVYEASIDEREFKIVVREAP